MSAYASIRKDIADYLAKNYDIALDAISPDSTLEDIGVDSLGVLGLATLLENRHGLTFETTLMMQVRTFADFMELVRTKSARAG